VTIRDAEAAHVRELARRVVMGETLRGLCRDLEARGVSTVTGRPWQTFTLRRLLCSPRVAGLRQHQGEPIGEAVWPAIVDRGTWEAVRRRLLNPGRNVRSVAPRSYLLTGGLAVCGVCGDDTRPGAKLVARPRSDKARCYVCASGPNFNGCGKIRALADSLEEHVVDSVLAALDGPGLDQALARRAETLPIGNTDADELADVERRLDELAEDFADGAIDRRQWATARKRLEARRDALNARLAASGPSPLAALTGDIYEGWERLNFDQRRAVIAAVVDRVIVNPAVRGRNTFDPDRVNIRWRA
jgi:hypothetical protein